jgi:hypothetical protein
MSFPSFDLVTSWQVDKRQVRKQVVNSTLFVVFEFMVVNIRVACLAKVGVPLDSFLVVRVSTIQSTDDTFLFVRVRRVHSNKAAGFNATDGVGSSSSSNSRKAVLIHS